MYVKDELAPLDPVSVANVLSNPPFVTIEGVINVRDLGSYPSTTHPGHITRPGLLFRSADLSHITENGEAQMKALGIAKVFDLRSDTEIAKYNSEQRSINGIEIQRVPVFRTEDYSPEMMAKRYRLYASGKTEAFMELYSQILDHAGPSFGTILRYIRDHPTQGCLFHCTAGKDRTGLIAAIIMKLAGVGDNDVANDYALSRVGREPAREMIMARLSKEPLFASDSEAALNMMTCRHETMMTFLSHLEEKYGGVETYARRYLGLSDKDITLVRNNILVPNDSAVI